MNLNQRTLQLNWTAIALPIGTAMHVKWAAFQDWTKSLRSNVVTATLERWLSHIPLGFPRTSAKRYPHSARSTLLQNEQWLAALFYASPVAICISTLDDGRILLVNESFSRMTGYISTEVTGKTTDEIGLWVNPNDAVNLRQLLLGHESIRDLETAWQTTQGEIRYALLMAEQIDLDGEPGILMLAHDITTRKQAEEEQQRLLEQIRASRGHLHTLSQRLFEVQETERRQLARELHDEIGQSLTGLKLVLEAAARAPAGTTTNRLGEAQILVNELIGRVRNLSLELRPAMLDDLGLLPALLWLIERYTTQTQIHVEFGQSGLERRFAPDIETAAFRIAQEALTNVARHANTNEVSVRFWVDENVLHLEVEDWGAGFDVKDALTPGRSSGLTGMRERANLLGGQCAIESVCGVGTRAHAELPLDGCRLERRSNERNDTISR